VRESGGRSKTQPPLVVRGQCERGDLQLANPRWDSITRARERILLIPRRPGRDLFSGHNAGLGEGEVLQKLSERRDSRPIRGISRAFEPSPLNEPLAIETRLYTRRRIEYPVPRSARFKRAKLRFSASRSAGMPVLYPRDIKSALHGANQSTVQGWKVRWSRESRGNVQGGLEESAGSRMPRILRILIWNFVSLISRCNQCCLRVIAFAQERTRERENRIDDVSILRCALRAATAAIRILTFLIIIFTFLSFADQVCRLDINESRICVSSVILRVWYRRIRSETNVSLVCYCQLRFLSKFFVKLTASVISLSQMSSQHSNCPISERTKDVISFKFFKYLFEFELSHDIESWICLPLGPFQPWIFHPWT